MFIHVFFAFVLFFSFVKAETLEEILNKAEEKSPLLKSYKLQIEKLKGELLRAERIPNPEVEIEFGRILSQSESGFVLTSLTAVQPLRLWNEKKFAILSVKERLKAEKLFLKSNKNILFGNIYKAFYQALYMKELLKLKKQEKNLVEDIYKFVKSGYKLGEKTPLDVIRAEKEVYLVKSQIKELSADYQNSLQKLSSLAGFKVTSVDGDFFKIKDIENLSVEDIPAVKGYDFLIKSLKEDIKRQKALAKPQISIGLTVGEDEADLGKYEFGFLVSSTIPAFYRRQGEIFSLSAEKNRIIQEKKQKILELSSRLESIKRKIDVLKEILNSLDKDTIPKVKKALDIASTSFKNGAISFFEYSSIRKEYFDALNYKLRIVNQLHSLTGDFISIGGYKK